MDLDGVGGRLSDLRKQLGLTQQQLAARTHFSMSLIKKVEQGSLPPSSAFVASAAKALKVKESYLYGTEERDAAEQPTADAAGIAELRSALDAYDFPRPEGDPLTLATIAQRLNSASDDVYGLKYAEATRVLPNLLHHLYVLVENADHEGEQARALLHDAYRMSATVAGRFRQADLAAIASERHVQLAPHTGDPIRVAISAYHRSSRHLQNGDYRDGLGVLERVYEHTTAGQAGRAVSVQLHLRSAVLAARNGDLDQADGHISEARAMVGQYRPPTTPYYNVDASALNVTVHWCAVPMETYNGTESVRRAQVAQVDDPQRPERVAHHYIDMGRAWMLHGDRQQALASLNTARRIAPFNTRHHPSVRETVLAIGRSDRRVTESLADFARWAGITL